MFDMKIVFFILVLDFFSISYQSHVYKCVSYVMDANKYVLSKFIVIFIKKKFLKYFLFIIAWLQFYSIVDMYIYNFDNYRHVYLQFL